MNKQMKYYFNDHINISLKETFHHNTFWGKSDSEGVFNYLRDVIDKNKVPIFNIDLDGVKNFDTLFCQNVFIPIYKLNNSRDHKHKKIILITTNDDEIHFKLNIMFQKSELSVLIKRSNDDIEISGSTDYSSKVILNKIRNYSPIAPNVVRSELGMNEEVFMQHISKLVEMGIATKTRRGLYKSIIQRKDLKSTLRSLIKSLKVLVSPTPVYQFSFFKQLNR